MKNVLLAATVTAGFIGMVHPSVAQMMEDNMIDVENIKTMGDTVVVPSASIDKDGFLVIHAMKDGAPVLPDSIGHTMITAGTNTDVEVTTDYPLVAGEDYLAMLHYDTNGNGEYEFGPGMTDVDGPVVVDGNPVVAPFSGM